MESLIFNTLMKQKKFVIIIFSLDLFLYLERVSVGKNFNNKKYGESYIHPFVIRFVCVGRGVGRSFHFLEKKDISLMDDVFGGHRIY